jgi:release factor glutamine methyltransferase
MTITLVQAWKAARDRLTAAGLDSPVIDARLLVEAATLASRTDIITDPKRPLTDAQAAELDAFLHRRERREPVSHILGRKGFWNVILHVSRDVLTPRPDTEALVDLCLKAFAPAARFRMLDLGVGSGAIMLALLAERPGASGLGVDVSEEALAVARDNAARLGLAGRAAFLRSDWTVGLADESFELVAANPPYIPTADIALLDPEVRDHEPLAALDGGPDGLDAYRELAPQILRVLKPGGLFVLEVGPGQAGPVQLLMAGAGGIGLWVSPDYGGHDRVVAGRKKPLGNAEPIR